MDMLNQLNVDFAVTPGSYKFLNEQEVIALSSYAPSTLARKDRELSYFNDTIQRWWGIGRSESNDIKEITPIQICTFINHLSNVGWGHQSVVPITGV